MNDQTIIRSPHGEDRPYVSTCRASAQDRRLSWEARGMLWYLLSRPDDWQVRISDLMQNCGRDKTRNILAELLKYGYLEKTKQARKDGNKFGEVEYRIHETPFTEIPSTVSPSTENPTLHNKEVHKKEDIKTSVVKSDLPPSGIFKAYLDTFGEAVSPGEHDLLRDIAGLYTQAEFAVAFRITKIVNSKKRITRKVAYAYGILKDWAANGYPDNMPGGAPARVPTLEELGYTVVR